MRLPRHVAAAAVVAASAFLAGAFASELQGHPYGVIGAVVSLAIIAAPAATGAWRWLGPRRGLALLVLLGAYAVAIETMGVRTGLPYGGFRYGQAMGPLVGGWVPATLPLGYVPLVLGALAVTGRLAPAARLPAWLTGGIFLVVSDVALDPGAVALGYWAYDAPGAFHGVPWSNFLGWLATGCTAVWLALRVAAGAGRPPDVFLVSAAWTLAFWTGVTVAHRLIVPGAVGLGMTLLLAALVVRPALAARSRRASRPEP